MIYDSVNQLELVNKVLEKKTAHERVEYALKNFAGRHALSSSFGAQSAVSLHLLNEVSPNIPVILIDTGYLFAETYQFVDQLVEQLSLNLKVYRAKQSPAWQEARFGKQWEQGIEGLEQYNQRNKVEPMDRALNELGINSWFAGLRRDQSKSRAGLPVAQRFKGRFKVHPIIDWNNKQLHRYLTKYQLPYHPLWEEGYVSIGDYHSTRPLYDGMNEEDTRFGGVQRECGLHLDNLSGL